MKENLVSTENKLLTTCEKCGKTLVVISIRCGECSNNVCQCSELELKVRGEVLALTESLLDLFYENNSSFYSESAIGSITKIKDRLNLLWNK